MGSACSFKAQSFGTAEARSRLPQIKLSMRLRESYLQRGGLEWDGYEPR